MSPNPYDFYRDMRRWYRLINPASAGVEQTIKVAIDSAEEFHKSLGDYYHPNTYAFYGDDPQKLAFGRVRWIARQGSGSGIALTTANVATAKFLGHTQEGRRTVLVEGKIEMHFEPEPQDAGGDGTVPHQSGAGPTGKIKQVFATRGYDHQGSYKAEDMLMLTLRLIVKTTEGIPI